MAKEVKKGSKKVAAKPAAKAVKKAPVKKAAKKVVREPRVVKKDNTAISVVYMFLLILGVALVFVSLTLKLAGYADTRLMLTCLGIALVILILSAFVKKMAE